MISFVTGGPAETNIVRTAVLSSAVRPMTSWPAAGALRQRSRPVARSSAWSVPALRTSTSADVSATTGAPLGSSGGPAAVHTTSPVVTSRPTSSSGVSRTTTTPAPTPRSALPLPLAMPACCQRRCPATASNPTMLIAATLQRPASTTTAPDDVATATPWSVPMGVDHRSEPSRTSNARNLAVLVVALHADRTVAATSSTANTGLGAARRSHIADRSGLGNRLVRLAP